VNGGNNRHPTIWAKNCGLVLVSASESVDKPLKYPTIFNSADIAVIAKIDLADAVELDWTGRAGEHSGSAAGHEGAARFVEEGREVHEFGSVLASRNA
jgi:hypothetical protein